MPHAVHGIGGFPFVVLVRPGHVSGIGNISVDGQAGLSGISQGKKTGQITVVGSSSSFHIGNEAYCILLFEVDIHHQRLLGFGGGSGDICCLMLPLVHFDLINDIVRQIVQCYFCISVEKVFSVDEQAAHKLAVHRDAPSAELYSRKLGDQRIEH